MLVSEYDLFVQNSDQSVGKPHGERLDIATYGLAAEIGSVVAAIKKRLLGENGIETWNVPNAEIRDELGDVVWYCFSLARIANAEKPINILSHDIANLRREIGASDERADRLRLVLCPTKREEFLEAAESFPRRTKVMTFEDYQDVAFLTARTQDRTLVEVCLAVLWQLSAQLFRRLLPDIELELNQSLRDKQVNDTLGEIAWHVSALASIYGLRLSEVAAQNMKKVSFRLDRGHPTALHDDACSPSEQLPRKFEVVFVTVEEGRSQMYLNGKRLGNELDDNAPGDDGYRFHDIMHLSNAAKLGWSPVLRDLLKRKRKSNPTTDRVEDGARAGIVEEAVIKAIHSEGTRLAALRPLPKTDEPERLFSAPGEITFRFLKFIHDFVEGLEVHKNTYWEWEDAILTGHEIFYRLRCEGQGTVSVDLEKRTVEFRPDAYVPLRGSVAGLGSATLSPDDWANDRRFQAEEDAPNSEDDPLSIAVQKLAILDALGFRAVTAREVALVSITEVPKGISVKAAGVVRQAMWDRKVVAFQTTSAPASDGALFCTAIALADD